jgi:hypothetical protein
MFFYRLYESVGLDFLENVVLDQKFEDEVKIFMIQYDHLFFVHHQPCSGEAQHYLLSQFMEFYFSYRISRLFLKAIRQLWNSLFQQRLLVLGVADRGLPKPVSSFFPTFLQRTILFFDETPRGR